MQGSPSIDHVPQSLGDLLSLHDEPFVRAAYLAMLGRAVDEPGLRNYTALLRSGASREAIVVALAESEEALRGTRRTLPGLPAFVEQHRPRKTGLWRGALRRLGRHLTAHLEPQFRAQHNNLAALGYQLFEQLGEIRSRTASNERPLASPSGMLAQELEASVANAALPDATLAAALRLSTALRSSHASD